MLKRNKMPSTLLKMAVLGALAAPTVTWAHGAVSDPIARQYKCQKDEGYNWPSDGSGVPNAACRQAFLATGTLSPYIATQWHEVAKNVADYNNQAAVEHAVPSGKLCSAADPQKRGLDLPSPEWHKTTVTPKDGKIKLSLDATAAHYPSWVKIYLSKPGYNPQNSIGWEDLELIYEAQAPVPQTSAPHWTYDVTFPAGRSGDAVLFTHWQRIDPAGEGFYNCSDIKIVGGDSDTVIWHSKGPFVAQKNYPLVGDTVRFRVMGHDAAHSEVVDEKLAITAQNQAPGVWAQELATILNSRYAHYVNVGIATGSGNSYDPNKLHDNKVFVKNEKDSFAMSIIAGEETAPVVKPPAAKIDGPTEIGSGKALTLDASKSVNGSGGSDRLSYAWNVHSLPYNGPLNMPVLQLTAPQLEVATQFGVQVTVTDSANGKADTASLVFTVTPPVVGEYPAYVAGTSYKGGMKVSNYGANYECKPFPYEGWCGQAPDAYEPGKGRAWADAWIKL